MAHRQYWLQGQPFQCLNEQLLAACLLFTPSALPPPPPPPCPACLQTLHLGLALSARLYMATFEGTTHYAKVGCWGGALVYCALLWYAVVFYVHCGGWRAGVTCSPVPTGLLSVVVAGHSAQLPRCRRRAGRQVAGAAAEGADALAQAG